MKKAFWSLFFWLRSLIRSFKLINKIHLMDHVWYNGKEYVINNGTQWPIWDLSPVERDADGRCPSIFIHQDDFKKPFWRNIKNSAFSNHRWYMMYWFDLDVRKKVFGY